MCRKWDKLASLFGWFLAKQPAASFHGAVAQMPGTWALGGYRRRRAKVNGYPLQSYGYDSLPVLHNFGCLSCLSKRLSFLLVVLFLHKLAASCWRGFQQSRGNEQIFCRPCCFDDYEHETSVQKDPAALLKHRNVIINSSMDDVGGGYLEGAVLCSA